MINQNDLLNEVTWQEADGSIARALRDMPVLDRQLERVGDAKVTGAANLVLQWVRQAARVRHIQALGAAGDKVAFDPVYHEDFDEEGFELGEEVQIVKPAIVRGSKEINVVLVRGEVTRG